MSKELSGTFYEWDTELCDIVGDIYRHDHAVKLDELKNTPTEITYMKDGVAIPTTTNKNLEWSRLVLIRTVFKDGELKDTSWGYVTKNGELPTHTDGGEKIPQKYHKEFEQNKEWASKLGDNRIDWEANLNELYNNKKEN